MLKVGEQGDSAIAHGPEGTSQHAYENVAGGNQHGTETGKSGVYGIAMYATAIRNKRERSAEKRTLPLSA